MPTYVIQEGPAHFLRKMKEYLQVCFFSQSFLSSSVSTHLGRAYKKPPNDTRYDPLVGGCQIQAEGSKGVGTLGVIFRDGVKYYDKEINILTFSHFIVMQISNKVYGLTNAHVVSHHNFGPSDSTEILVAQPPGIPQM